MTVEAQQDPFTQSAANAPAGPQTLETRIGKLTFTHDFANGYPTRETIEKLYDERDFQRACQAYLWALPFVSCGEVERVLMQAPGAAHGDIVLVETYSDLSRFLTANATTPYAVVWLNLARNGPYVLEIPAGPSAGFVDDLWQRPVTDIGLPGPDKGQGGRFLVLGPGQEAPSNVDGYIVVRSATLNNLAIIRLLSEDPEERRAMLEKVRLYPFRERSNPPATKVLRLKEGGHSVANAPRGMEYWEQLARWIDEEPVEERDRVMMAMLRSIGIKKGKPFHPDNRLSEILTEAALVGEAMAKANDFDKRQIPLARYRDGSRWDLALCLDVNQEAEFHTELDERAAWFYEATATSEGMVTKTPGVGSVYLGAYKDKQGGWLDGSETYRLRVPPKAPVEQFWSLTIYDVNTRALIQNKEQRADRSSRMDLVTNADGSVDLYVGPSAPTGFEKNWIPSVPAKAWFAYFRLYAPTEAHFNGQWTLPDFQKVQ
jgi:hypothetical protein